MRMGYQLFLKGHTAPAGDAEAAGKSDQQLGNWSLKLKHVAPSVFFVVAGAAVAIFVIMRPIELKTHALPADVAALVLKAATNQPLNLGERNALLAWMGGAQSTIVVAQSEHPQKPEPEGPDMETTAYKGSGNSESWYDPILRTLGFSGSSRQGF